MILIHITEEHITAYRCDIFVTVTFSIPGDGTRNSSRTFSAKLSDSGIDPDMLICQVCIFSSENNLESESNSALGITFCWIVFFTSNSFLIHFRGVW